MCHEFFVNVNFIGMTLQVKFVEEIFNFGAPVCILLFHSFCMSQELLLYTTIEILIYDT